MAQILLGGRRVESAEQFGQLVEEAMQHTPAQAVPMVRLDVVQENIRNFIQEWRSINPDLNSVQVGLVPVLMDFCGMIGLSEEEAQEVING